MIELTSAPRIAPVSSASATRRYGKRGTLEHEDTLRLALQAIRDACARRRDRSEGDRRLLLVLRRRRAARRPCRWRWARRGCATPRWSGAAAAPGWAARSRTRPWQSRPAWPRSSWSCGPICQGKARFGQSLAGMPGRAPGAVRLRAALRPHVAGADVRPAGPPPHGGVRHDRRPLRRGGHQCPPQWRRATPTPASATRSPWRITTRRG